MKCDYVIIGGGLIGLTTAYHLLRARPGSSVRILEKEPTLAFHQSSRNSGVLHSGIFYKPHSLKARLCIEGRREILEFAQEHAIPHTLSGKLLVANSKYQLKQIEILREHARESKIAATLLTKEEIQEREPHAVGMKGLWIPNTGVIDFKALADALAQEIKRLGGEIICDAKVRAATRTGSGWILEGTCPLTHASFVVNCAGLFSDKVARAFGDRTESRVIPFRSEYYSLRPSAQHLCKSMIYPVPDTRFPFLGVHFTRRADGIVECGPNAVLAFAREGYAKNEFNLRDVTRMLRFRGFQRLMAHHWKIGAREMYRSLSRRAFVSALQKIVPEVSREDLVKARTGVQAQLVRPDGTFEEDFAFKRSPFVLHVTNAPSPGATACFAIGKMASQIVLGAHED